MTCEVFNKLSLQTALLASLMAVVLSITRQPST